MLVGLLGARSVLRVVRDSRVTSGVQCKAAVRRSEEGVASGPHNISAARTSADGRVSPPWAVILAAGKGTRMNSDLPKVVHEVAGRPMVCHVVDACFDAGCTHVVLVVGYQAERVKAAVGDRPGVSFALQAEQLGTGHAVMCARDELAPAVDQKLDALVLCGDGPLIRSRTLTQLLSRHRQSRASATLATAVVEDATGYGRIVRDSAGRFDRIVEHKNAGAEQRAIREINPSYYCFSLPELFWALQRVGRDAASGEYYLTDTLALLREAGRPVEVIEAVPAEDVLSINTPAQLAEVDSILRARLTMSTAAMPTAPQQGAAARGGRP